MKKVCSAVLAVACAPSLLACDICAVYSAAQAHGEIGKGFSAGVAEQFTHFGTLQDSGNEVPDEANQHLDSSVSQLFVGYNFSERFGVQLNLPVIHRSFKRPEGFETDRGTESGIGDVSLIGHYQLIHRERMDRTFTWTVIGGIKLPTGNSDRLKEELDEVEVPGAPESGIHGHDLALGSGSVDGIVGTGMFARFGRGFFSANAQYAIRTEGRLDYQYANDFTWAGGPGAFLMFDEEQTLALQFVVSGETKPRDKFQGERAEDTGITAVYLGPQINYTWSDKLSAELGLDLPVSIQNTALQMVPDWRVRAAVTWHF
ncbi:MAG: hypothetical protein HOP33_03150 [Verrucomicrobia bacterium]|nr:hypothetical protein [Verrucomicrobiota bacterium]